MLIPPSLLLIIYGLVAEESVGKLFIAAVIPGIILAIVFCIGIWLLATLQAGLRRRRRACTAPRTSSRSRCRR